MSRPDYQPVEPVERIVMPDAGKAPGSPHGEILLGQAPDGAWLSGLGVWVKDSGWFTGLGWWPDLGREAYPTRDAALAGALDHIERWLASRTERAGAQRVASWLRELGQPQQIDLFGVAA